MTQLNLGHVVSFLFTVLLSGLMITSFFALHHDQPSPFVDCHSSLSTGARYVLQSSHDKYHLYLYRKPNQTDQVIDPPVLFIPGHAGSFRQVETLASAATHLTIFTVDLHEELTALDGQSVLDQATFVNEAIETILGQHTSVILIGHSMGGVVARTALTLPNHRPGSVHTLVTFSTPHTHSPVPIDPVLETVYTKIDTRSVNMMSVAGGPRDITIHSDAVILPSLDGLTVFTSMIPRLWTSLGHNDILTCSVLAHIVMSHLLHYDTLQQAMTIGMVDMVTFDNVSDWTMVPSVDIQPIYTNKTLITLDHHLATGLVLLTTNDHTNVCLCDSTGCDPVTTYTLVPANQNGARLFIKLTKADLERYDYVAIDQGVVWIDSDQHQIVMFNTSLAALAWGRIHITLPTSLYSMVQVPHIAHPLLVYRLTTNTTSSHTFIRHSEFAMDLTRPIHLITHDSGTLVFEVWHGGDFTLTMDWYLTLGRIGVRYGILILPYSFIVVLLVFTYQLVYYHRTGLFPSFGEGLDVFYRRILPVVILLLGGWRDYVGLLALVLSTGLITGVAILCDGLLRYGGGYVPSFRLLVVFLGVGFLVLPPSITFLIFFLIHIQTCLRAYKKSRIKPYGMNSYHHMHTVLVQLVTILPLQLPGVAVWVRNHDLALGWYSPGWVVPILLYLARLASCPSSPHYHSRLVLVFVVGCTFYFGLKNPPILTLLTSVIYTWYLALDLWNTFL